MWHDCIGEMMSPHVSVGVWGLRCSKTITKTSAVRCKECLNVVFLELFRLFYCDIWTMGKLTGTVSWCSRGLNSRICSHSAVQLQSCALTNRPICDPKPEEDTMMTNDKNI